MSLSNSPRGTELLSEPRQTDIRGWWPSDDSEELGSREGMATEKLDKKLWVCEGVRLLRDPLPGTLTVPEHRSPNEDRKGRMLIWGAYSPCRVVSTRLGLFCT